MEIWKDVIGYEDLYEVSSYGRVRRKETHVKTGIKHNELRKVKSTILKQNLKRNGYYSVDLSKDNNVKTISVHRIVALAFIPNDDPEKNVVNHKNANKKDNRITNLEWVTRQGNVDHAKENHLFHSHPKKIRCKQLNMVFAGSYSAAEYINEKCFKGSKQIKNMASKIRTACCGIQKSAYGFTWEYLI